MHVRDDDGLPALGCGPADAPPKGYPDACDLPLERAQDELASLQEIEAGPVQARQGLKEQGGHVRRVGEAIPFAGEHRRQLAVQFVVAGPL